MQYKEFFLQTPLGMEIWKEARDEGYLEGQQTVLMSVWKMKFGELTEDVKLTLLTSNRETLATLIQRIALVDTIDEARILLEL
jgi:hypothetical protein